MSWTPSSWRAFPIKQQPTYQDKELLQKIAGMTGGRYFRADNNKKLKEIYKEIDTLEKSKIDVQEFRKKHEAFVPFALLALALFSLEIILRYLVFRRFP